MLRNVGIFNSDAGELPKRKHNIFLPILFAALGALGGLAIGVAAITNAVKTAQHQSAEQEVKRHNKEIDIIIIIIIILFIYCNWVVTRWQWLCYMYTKHEIGYY